MHIASYNLEASGVASYNGMIITKHDCKENN